MDTTPIQAFLAALALAVAAARGVAAPSPGAIHPQGGERVTQAAADPAYGTYAWPVRGPVLRGFRQPSDPYGPGHRGIDIGAPQGTSMVAAQRGVVAFAGSVGGSLFISIDHPDGVRTTYSWLSVVGVRKGQQVSRGETIGATGRGHPDLPQPQLHFGARIGTTYIDPMLLLEGGDLPDLIHLAPLDGR